jgi:hypothetical protein
MTFDRSTLAPEQQRLWVVAKGTCLDALFLLLVLDIRKVGTIIVGEYPIMFGAWSGINGVLIWRRNIGCGFEVSFHKVGVLVLANPGPGLHR